MYRYYAVRRFLGDGGHDVAQVNTEGDVTLSDGDRHPLMSPAKTLPDHENSVPPLHTSEHDNDKEEKIEEHTPQGVGNSTAFKFLLAGGIAGAASRTATAPFDRLKSPVRARH